MGSGDEERDPVGTCSALGSANHLVGIEPTLLILVEPWVDRRIIEVREDQADRTEAPRRQRRGRGTRHVPESLGDLTNVRS